MPPRKKQRCAFVERGRQCSKVGIGSPVPLCDIHADLLDDELEDPVDELLDGIQVRAEEGLGRLGQWLKDKFSEAQARHEQEQRRRPPPRTNGHHRPPPVPQPPREDPRIVMGFPPNLPLTQKAIKDRKKRLAELWHPDVGGSEEAMKRLNQAADELLRSIRA